MSACCGPLGFSNTNMNYQQICVQGFATAKCENTNEECNCTSGGCGNGTNLLVSGLFQRCNGCGVSFTNSLDGPPRGTTTGSSICDFAPISGFSNISISGIPNCSRVILQNCNTYGTLQCPVLTTPPLGKTPNPCGFYEYTAQGGCFKFGPVHLGYDTWRDALPSSPSPSSCVDVTLKGPQYVGDQFSVCTTPVVIQVLIIPGGRTSSCCQPLCLNVELFVQSCESGS